MGPAQWIVLLVAAQRLGELALSRRNARRLLAAGGRELGRRHYPLLVGLHAGWLLAMFLLIPPDATLHPLPLALFLVAQAGRIWVIASLGGYWTTRVIDLPDTPLVRSGPYRWLRHPNYLIVIAELALLPMAFGAWEIALAFSALNLAVLRLRLRVENAALARRVTTGIRG